MAAGMSKRSSGTLRLWVMDEKCRRVRVCEVSLGCSWPCWMSPMAVCVYKVSIDQIEAMLLMSVGEKGRINVTAWKACSGRERVGRRAEGARR